MDPERQPLIPPRRLYPLFGVLISVVIALSLTSGLIFDSWAQAKWSDSPDSVALTHAGRQADASTVLSWWHGPWIEGEMYYRPLSSMLMWAESRLWGFNFFPYTIVSWPMHAANSALAFLLLYSLCPGPRWQRTLSGIVAALMFNLGHHPEGAYWVRARVAWGVMIWWPVQTDFGSLLFALLSLVVLDRYLTKGKPRLGWALGAFLAALLFKETPLALIALVPFIALYRNKPWVRVTLYYAGLGAVLFILRALFVPSASNPEWMGAYTFYKLLTYVHLLSAELLHGGEIWEYVAMVSLAGLIYGLWKLRVPALYIVLASLAWPLLIGGLLTGNPAIATIPREMLILLRYAGVIGGFVLALTTAGREPALIFIIGLFAVATANVNRIGPHYWYYPVWMWGMVDGAVLNAAINFVRDRIALKKQAGEAEVEKASTEA
ncbi:MAG: hypothetical protein ABFE07_17880 [Armatimonadia bacterium]